MNISYYSIQDGGNIIRVTGDQDNPNSVSVWKSELSLWRSYKKLNLKAVMNYLRTKTLVSITEEELFLRIL